MRESGPVAALAPLGAQARHLSAECSEVFRTESIPYVLVAIAIVVVAPRHGHQESVLLFRFVCLICSAGLPLLPVLQYFHSIRADVLMPVLIWAIWVATNLDSFDWHDLSAETIRSQ